MTEEELASKCKLADNQARKELYELYGGSLMAICLRYIGDREAAEDVLHDGFVRGGGFFNPSTVYLSARFFEGMAFACDGE